MSRLLAVALLTGLSTAAQTGLTGFDFWPGVSYDPAVPSIEKTLGYKPGERVSWHASIVRYFEALAAAQPNRIKVWEYGKTWEGRRLIYAAVGSEANIRRLAEIKAAVQKLDPRKTSDAEARKLLASMPAVIWLGYGVHGNEISSPDAAMLTAYHLLAARRDPVVDSILANVMVLIDPLQNPDGRDRFVHHFEQSEGLEPDPDPSAAEHVEPWPNGRTNHYHFDMNRDWIFLTQPETRGRARTLLEWLPQVFVDLHEMGSDSTYYFAPEAVPYNPHLTANQRTSLDWFGRNNAKWFDKYGFHYFTREVYDAFYPGYGASWPAYYGAIAMTYEQASARGLVMRKSDGTVFHYRDTVRRHFVASISTAEAAAANRTKLLENFWEYRRTAVQEGTNEAIKEYVLPRRGADVSAVDKLAQLLANQGIEVHRSRSAFDSFPAGSYVVRLNQPQKRMARTLLDTKVGMEENFLKEQERRRRKKLPDEIYDITAWSLPLVYNVEAVPSEKTAQGNFELLAPGAALPKGSVTGKAEVAYLVPWGTQAAARFLTAAVREQIRIRSTDKTFKQNGREYPRGTLIVPVKENPDGLAVKVERIAAASGAEVVGTDTGWVDDGVNFGSRWVFTMKQPRVAVAWDRPVSAGSAGHTRYVLERMYRYPVTPIRVPSLGSADLSRFDVLVLPDGEYPASLMTRLKEWVRAGGTLIGIGEAVRTLADAKNGILQIQQEALPKPAGKSEEKKADDSGRVPGTLLESDADFDKAIEPVGASPDEVAGVLVTARTDDDHWLTAGVTGTVNAMLSGRNVFTPVRIDKGTNAAVLLGPEKLLASGYLWEENRKLLAHKPLVVVQKEGKGFAIGFMADPNFRAMMDGLNVLFVNAVFRGPAHAR